jgi:hypothetical protein
VRGAHAPRLLAGEAGTHMIRRPHANLILMQVDVVPVAPGESESAALASHFERHRQWRSDLEAGRADAGDDPFRFGPVVRVYQIGGNTFDLRSGRVAPTPPDAEALRGFLLAGLTVERGE